MTLFFNEDLNALTYEAPFGAGYTIELHLGKAGVDGPRVATLECTMENSAHVLPNSSLENLSTNAVIAELYEQVEQRNVYLLVKDSTGVDVSRGQVIPSLHRRV